MLTDFKFSTIVDNGVTAVVTVRFYEGEVATKDEDDPEIKGGKKPVTRYRRSAFLEERTVTFPVGTDYGTHFKRELKKAIKGKIREPIPEQA